MKIRLKTGGFIFCLSKPFHQATQKLIPIAGYTIAPEIENNISAAKILRANSLGYRAVTSVVRNRITKVSFVDFFIDGKESIGHARFPRAEPILALR